MTIIEAINKLDALKPNTYSQEDKVKWLSELDAKVKILIVDTHEGDENVSFTGYDNDTDLHTELLIPEPFDECYLRWMEAQVHYLNDEFGKYNNAMKRYNSVWDAYKSYYNRTHMPKGTSFKFF